MEKVPTDPNEQRLIELLDEIGKNNVYTPKIAVRGILESYPKINDKWGSFIYLWRVNEKFKHPNLYGFK